MPQFKDLRLLNDSKFLEKQITFDDIISQVNIYIPEAIEEIKNSKVPGSVFLPPVEAFGVDQQITQTLNDALKQYAIEKTPTKIEQWYQMHAQITNLLTTYRYEDPLQAFDRAADDLVLVLLSDYLNLGDLLATEKRQRLNEVVKSLTTSVILNKTDGLPSTLNGGIYLHGSVNSWRKTIYSELLHLYKIEYDFLQSEFSDLFFEYCFYRDEVSNNSYYLQIVPHKSCKSFYKKFLDLKQRLQDLVITQKDLKTIIELGSMEKSTLVNDENELPSNARNHNLYTDKRPTWGRR